MTFGALSVINLLAEPLYFVPMCTSLLVNAFVGMNRLQAFFLAPETERSHEISWTEYLVDKKVKLCMSYGLFACMEPQRVPILL